MNPNERYLSDGDYDAMSGSIHAGTGVPIPTGDASAHSTPSVGNQKRRLIKAICRRLAFTMGGKVIQEGDLTIGAYPMEYGYGTGYLNYAGETGVSVTDDATNFVSIDAATATLQIDTDEFPSGAIPLAEVTATDGTITGIIDRRVWITMRDTPALESNLAGDGLILEAGLPTVGAGNGIYVLADEIAVNLAVNPGLEFVSGSLAVKVDGVTITRTASGLGLMNSSVSAVKLHGTEVSLLLPKVSFDIYGSPARYVRIYFKNANGLDGTGDRNIHFTAWITQNLATLQVASSVPSTTSTFLNGAELKVITTKAMWEGVANNISYAQYQCYHNTAGNTWYLVISVEGRLFVSPAITF